jgi:hypothetical protein
MPELVEIPGYILFTSLFLATVVGYLIGAKDAKNTASLKYHRLIRRQYAEQVISMFGPERAKELAECLYDEKSVQELLDRYDTEDSK